VDLPANAEVRNARFLLAADNDFSLYVNGKQAGASSGAPEGWRDPTEVDLKAQLKPGRNLFMIYATNTSQDVSPAGLIGAYRIELADGTAVGGSIDESWGAARLTDQKNWEPAEKIAPFGGGPWGVIGGKSEVPQADLFEGGADWPSAPDTARERVMLVMDGVQEGVRVQFNGQEAGGCIGAPFMLDVTGLVKAGPNTVRIEPFAPKSVKLAAYAR